MKKELFNVFKTYVLTWLIIGTWFVINAKIRGLSIVEAMVRFVEFLKYKQFLIFIHVVFFLLFILFLICRYFIRVYKKKGITSAFKQFALRFVLPIAVIVLTVNYIFVKNTTDNYKYVWNTSFENAASLATAHFEKDKKQRGMTVFGWQYNSNENAINELVKNNIEWVAVVPFIDQENEQTEVVNHRLDSIGKWRRRDSIFVKTISDLKRKHIKVMLKPHIWIGDGWRSNINFDTENQWNVWFESYKEIILHYAHMAKNGEVELFCIGTELSSSIKQQPEKWRQLIKEVKQIYKGKLTYAANWYDEYEHIDFWDALDFIGIQAYFPLTDHKTPKLESIIEGWKPHKEKLKALSEHYNKPILFTEIGYRSDASATIKPWEWNSFTNISINQRSTETQQLAYEALFQSFWNEDWFAGTYIWQWNTGTTKERALKSLDFTPRFKPALNTMAKWYGNYNSLQK